MVKGILKVEDGNVEELYDWIEAGLTAKTDEFIIETSRGDVVITTVEDGRIEIKTPNQ